MKDFEIKVGLSKNIPFVLDAVLEIGVGIIAVSKQPTDTTLLVVGLGFIVFGTIQLIRKIKTFCLTDTELIVKRPLFPFAFMEDRFHISKLKEVKFIKVKGRFGGPHLNVTTSDQAESFRIETTRDKIDEFEIKLKSLGIKAIREGM